MDFIELPKLPGDVHLASKHSRGNSGNVAALVRDSVFTVSSSVFLEIQFSLYWYAFHPVVVVMPLDSLGFILKRKTMVVFALPHLPPRFARELQLCWMVKFV